MYDRVGDRINLFVPLLDREARFLVRLVGTRNLVYNLQPTDPAGQRSGAQLLLPVSQDDYEARRRERSML
jgi:hypothetical protein